ncbi:hypothetical protein [Mesorhizobium erdmanii]|uniref:hypothetical protein n=1 Tax=Mesorhizobium erdmanii TaxID=1777866 RepID=UPI0012B584DB|nr:hypothetical protein [Mesorhizobium erdmanii]
MIRTLVIVRLRREVEKTSALKPFRQLDAGRVCIHDVAGQKLEDPCRDRRPGRDGCADIMSCHLDGDRWILHVRGSAVTGSDGAGPDEGEAAFSMAEKPEQRFAGRVPAERAWPL